MREHQIRVDDEVFRALQSHAEPLVDNANSVIRRLLGLRPRPVTADDDDNLSEPSAFGGYPDGPADKSVKAKQRPIKAARAEDARDPLPAALYSMSRPSSTRAPHGVLVPESEYELPLLQSLFEAGGKAPTSEVVEQVGQKMWDKFSEHDLATLRSGAPRWKSRLQFTRLNLIKQGLLRGDSARGTWELTDAGQIRAQQST